MYRILALSLLLLSLFSFSSDEVYADTIEEPTELWWHMNAEVRVNQTVVTAAVFNNSNRPIYCQGRVTGLTWRGFTLWSSMGTGVPPGRYAYVYVYTNPQDPFTNGYSNIDCRWF